MKLKANRVHDRRANAELLGCDLPLPLVFERIECREFIEALTPPTIYPPLVARCWSQLRVADFAEIRHL
jgi:hypothetical protein